MADELVLRWTSSQWAVSQVQLTGGRFSLSKSGIRSWEESSPSRPVQEVGQELRSWLKELQIGEGPVTVVLPREFVVLRKLDLPNAPDDELPDLVRFQAATKASTPIDELALDFLPLPALPDAVGRAAIAVTMERSRLARIEAILKVAGLTLQRVTLTAISVARLVQSLPLQGRPLESPALLLHQQGSSIEIAVFEQGSLVFSHGVRLPEDEATRHVQPLKSELNRLSVALGQMHLSSDIAHCYLVESGGLDSAVIDYLKERFPSRLTLLDDSTVPGPVRGYEALAGAAIRDSRTIAEIDLLHPRKKLEKPDRRRLYVTVGGGSAVLALLIGYMLVQSQARAYEDRIDALNIDQKKLAAEVSGGAPRVAYHGAISTWKSGHADLQQVWGQFASMLPGTSRLYLQNVKIEALSGDSLARITGKMLARSEAEINAFLQELSNKGHRPAAAVIESRGTDPDYPWEANLSVEMLRPKPPQSRPTGPGSSASPSSQKSS